MRTRRLFVCTAVRKTVLSDIVICYSANVKKNEDITNKYGRLFYRASESGRRFKPTGYFACWFLAAPPAGLAVHFVVARQVSASTSVHGVETG